MPRPDPGQTLPLDHDGPVDRPFEPFPATAEDGCVADRFDEMVRRYPDRLAIREGDLALSYADLAALVDRIAAACAAAAPPGAVVAVLLPHSAQFVAAFLGVLAAGRIVVPLDADHPPLRNQQIARHAGAEAVVSAGELAAQARGLFGEGMPVLDVEALPETSGAPPPRPGPDDLACILYTSGSTGAPKGVVQNHRGVVHNQLEWVNAAHIGPDDRMALFYSPVSVAGVGKALIALLTGGSLEVLSPVKLGAPALARELVRCRPTLINCSPTLFRHIVDALEPGQRLDSVRLVTLGGERIDWSDYDAVRRGCPPDALMAAHMGSTEVWTLYSHWFVDARVRADGSVFPPGRALPGRRLTMIGEDGLPAAPGEAGEAVVSSRHIALGYWRDPELTAAAFGIDPDDPGLRTYRTGDLVRERPDGLREFVGRRDAQIKLHGYRVEPGEVEGALRNCPGVQNAAIVVRRSEAGAPVALAAYVELEPGSEDLHPRHLMAMLSQRLAPHMTPSAIVVLDALPWLPNFKIDRQALQRIDDERAAARDGSLDPLVAEVARIFEEVLEVEGATGEDNLLSLGGDSLAATDIALEMNTRFGLDVDPAEFLATRSIAEWAEMIGKLDPVV